MRPPILFNTLQVFKWRSLSGYKNYLCNFFIPWSFFTPQLSTQSCSQLFPCCGQTCPLGNGCLVYRQLSVNENEGLYGQLVTCTINMIFNKYNLHQFRLKKFQMKTLEFFFHLIFFPWLCVGLASIALLRPLRLLATLFVEQLISFNGEPQTEKHCQFCSAKD